MAREAGWREPGLPYYLRAPNRVLITLLFLVFGGAMAYLGAHLSWMLVLVICFGLGMTLAGLVRMEWAVLGLVVMANFDGFLKPLFAERFSLFFKDYFILLGLVGWGWGLLLSQNRPSVRTPVALPIALFAGYVLAEVVNPNAASLLGSLAGARAWLLWLPVFFIGHDMMHSRAEIRRLWLLVTVISAVCAIYGVVQYFIGFEHLYRLSENFRYYERMGYLTAPGQRVLRVFSTMVHPGTFGAAMGFALLAATGMAFAARRRSAQIAAVLCLPLIAIGLFLSAARSAMVSTAVGALLFVLLARRPVLALVAGVVVVLAFVPAMTLTGGGIEKRLETVTWKTATERTTGPLVQGWDTAWEYPFGLGLASGVGIKGLKSEVAITPDLFVENDLGRAMAEFGIGALLYVALVVTVLIAAFRAYLQLPAGTAQVLSAALIGAIVATLISLATGAALYLAPGAAYFWLALATVLRLPEVEKAEAEAANARDGVAAGA